jgi:hypothetical protein
LVLPYTDDAAVHNAVALTLRFGAGEEVSIEELQRAATAATAGAYATAAAYAAAYAAYTATAGAYATAAYATAAARRGAILRQCAEIVRVVYPDPPEVTT